MKLATSDAGDGLIGVRFVFQYCLHRPSLDAETCVQTAEDESRHASPTRSGPPLQGLPRRTSLFQPPRRDFSMDRLGASIFVLDQTGRVMEPRQGLLLLRLRSTIPNLAEARRGNAHARELLVEGSDGGAHLSRSGGYGRLRAGVPGRPDQRRAGRGPALNRKPGSGRLACSRTDR